MINYQPCFSFYFGPRNPKKSYKTYWGTPYLSTKSHT